MESDVDTLRNEVNQLRVSFDALRDDVVAKLNQCTDHIRAVESLSKKATEMNAVLENQLANASNEEKEWKDIQVKLATTVVDGKVILNVGGDKYSTSVETLTREKDTFFTALFSKQWKLELDPDDKSIFIDRDGKLFQYILAYFRTMKIPVDVMSNESLRQSLIIEAEYFRLHDLIFILTESDREEQQRINPYFSSGTLIDKDQQTKLNEFYGKKDQRWSLIYKASRDGSDAAAFHTRCNNQGPTMTIMKSSNNHLFGGYTAISWTSDTDWKQDTTAFLFTLTNPHEISATKYSIDTAKDAHGVFHHAHSGPWFGGANEFTVSCHGNMYHCITDAFPHVYIDTTGEGPNTFTGAASCNVPDLEVYKLS